MTKLNEQARKTKIVWSFESESLSHTAFAKLNPDHIDAIRLVYDPDSHKSFVKFLKEVKKKSTTVPVIVDMAGKVRATITGLKEPKELEYDTKVKLVPEGGSGDFSVKTNVWDDLFSEGSMIFLGYGNVLLKTLSVSKNEVMATVVQGGTVLPDIEMHIPATRQLFSNQVEQQAQRLMQDGGDNIDFLVIPPLLDVASIKKLKKQVHPNDEEGPWLILKVNSEKAVHQIDTLIEEVDGIFISRLDMALTVDPAMVPGITKELIQTSKEHAKLVIVASEMLGSMRHNATPTRAEVSDIANAVHDGADAVVVSEEVAHGPYAERAVELIDRIVLDAEEQDRGTLNWQKKSPRINNAMDAVAFGAYRSSERMRAKAVVCITKSGNTALSLSAYGAPIPILAVTFSEATKRRLSLIHGVQAMLLEAPPSIDEVLPAINEDLVRESWLNAGDKIVFVSVTLSPISREASNLFTIQRLNEKIPRVK
jgi:pyruvate kinase